MKKKYKQVPTYKEEKTADYYSLKQDAVNDLAEALQDSEKVIKEEEINPKYKMDKKQSPYKYGLLGKIPTWLKAAFIKFWANGAICYFFFWGLGYYFSSMENLILITALGTGIINDFLITTALLYFESDKKEYHKYILVPVSCKKIWTLFANIFLALIEVYGVVMLYSLINNIINKINNSPSDTVALGVEPLLYGLLFVIVDAVLLVFKNVFVSIFKDAKNKINTK